MTRFRLVRALFARFKVQEREDRTLARFGKLEAIRQTAERPPVPLFLARKRQLA